MNLKYYFKQARKENWAIGQFNFSTLEQLKGILAGARDLKSPVILGTSSGESSFFGLEEAVALVRFYRIKYNIDAFLNLDHGKDIDVVIKAIEAGYPSVHFDGSSLGLKKNIKITKRIVEYARRKGVFVEGEIGIIKGESVPHDEKAVIKKEELASAEEAETFARETKVDSLAIAIGTTHGLYRGGKSVDLERLKKIKEKTNAFLVLHGGSGVKTEDIKAAIRSGVSKININTELRVIWKNSLARGLKRKEAKPYKILPFVEEAIRKKVAEKINVFGSKNKFR